MRKALTVISRLLLLPAISFATSQAPDVLIYNGKQYDLFANPLESFYENRNDRPNFNITPGSISSGNWRGYVATWKIDGGSLYLVEIDSWICAERFSDDCRKANLRGLFGQKYRAGKVKADWFTGLLRVPDGKMLRYVHMGYGSVYEREIVLKIGAGKVVGHSVIDNTKKQLPSELELQQQELEKMKPKPDER
jgi:hypothetical protein